jgi:hypothetical protein
LAVAGRGSEGDLPELGPDLALELGSFRHQGNVEVRSPSFEVLGELHGGGVEYPVRVPVVVDGAALVIAFPPWSRCPDGVSDAEPGEPAGGVRAQKDRADGAVDEAVKERHEARASRPR